MYSGAVRYLAHDGISSLRTGFKSLRIDMILLDIKLKQLGKQGLEEKCPLLRKEQENSRFSLVLHRKELNFLGYCR